MDWLYALTCFFAGALLVNARPRSVSNPIGRVFQSPFAKPRFFNAALGDLLIHWIRRSGPRSLVDVGVAGVGARLLLLLACRSHRFKGGKL